MAATALHHLSLNQVQTRCFVEGSEARAWLSSDQPGMQASPNNGIAAA
jgi:hypothetical protein